MCNPSPNGSKNAKTCKTTENFGKSCSLSRSVGRSLVHFVITIFRRSATNDIVFSLSVCVCARWLGWLHLLHVSLHYLFAFDIVIPIDGNIRSTTATAKQAQTSTEPQPRYLNYDENARIIIIGRRRCDREIQFSVRSTWMRPCPMSASFLSFYLFLPLSSFLPPFRFLFKYPLCRSIFIATKLNDGT